VIEVDCGLILKDVAPSGDNIPHVRRYEGVAHQGPLGEAHASAVAGNKSTWTKREGQSLKLIQDAPLTSHYLAMVMPSTPAAACASFFIPLAGDDARAEGRGRNTDMASHIT